MNTHWLSDEDRVDQRLADALFESLSVEGKAYCARRSADEYFQSTHPNVRRWIEHRARVWYCAHYEQIQADAPSLA